MRSKTSDDVFSLVPIRHGDSSERREKAPNYVAIICCVRERNDSSVLAHIRSELLILDGLDRQQRDSTQVAMEDHMIVVCYILHVPHYKWLYHCWATGT